MPNGGGISSFMEYIWAPFVGLFWWFINRLTGKIDEIEKEKADIGAIKRLDKSVHEIDKRLDELGHTTVPRPEYKSDITALHQRVNSLERGKEDKIKEMRIIDEKEKK